MKRKEKEKEKEERGLGRSVNMTKLMYFHQVAAFEKKEVGGPSPFKKAS